MYASSVETICSLSINKDALPGRKWVVGCAKSEPEYTGDRERERDIGKLE